MPKRPWLLLAGAGLVIGAIAIPFLVKWWDRPDTPPVVAKDDRVKIPNDTGGIDPTTALAWQKAGGIWFAWVRWDGKYGTLTFSTNRAPNNQGLPGFRVGERTNF